MLHTNSRNGYTVKVNTDYDTPKKGDIISGIVLTEDMKVGLDIQWNKDTQKYFAVPMQSKLDGAYCFYANGISWRVTD